MRSILPSQQVRRVPLIRKRTTVPPSGPTSARGSPYISDLSRVRRRARVAVHSDLPRCGFTRMSPYIADPVES